MALKIVFQNEHFVVIDKSVGTLSVPSRIGRQDPRPVAGIELQEFLGLQVYPIHRLDEDVSGLLLFGLTRDASRIGNSWFEGHNITKIYEALSATIPATDLERLRVEQKWECRLMRGKKRAYEAPFGKPSITLAKVVGHTQEERSIWHLQPLTGRAHQLRYEMARHGFPIDGDHLYGSTITSRSTPGIDLRAFKLDFSRCPCREEFNLPAEIAIEAFPSKT